MSKYLLIGTTSGTNFDDEEVWTNTWTVGIWESLNVCYEAAKDDLKELLTDDFTAFYGDDEEESSAQERVERQLNYEVNTNNLSEDELERKYQMYQPVWILETRYNLNDVNRTAVTYHILRIN